jgi:hypothetical protein
MRMPPPSPNMPDSTPAARPMQRKITSMGGALLGWRWGGNLGRKVRRL